MERPRARPRNLFKNGKERQEDEERDEGSDRDSPPPPPRAQKRRGRERVKSGGGGGVRENTVENDSDLDAAELNRKIERLQRDLTRRDRELDDERHENEKAMDKIKKLERDKVELKREVEDFRLEAEEYKRTLDEYREKLRNRESSSSERNNELDNYSDQNEMDKGDNGYHGRSKNHELTLNQKNREISQLIEDIEKLDDDKANLQEQLSHLKDNLEDATRQIDSMSNEHANLITKIESSEDQIRILMAEKTILKIKERDLMGFKERHEEYLDNLCKAVDVRVDIWKRLMLEKDEEIGRLNSKIEALVSQIPNMQLDSEQATIRHLQSKLIEREGQIGQLNDQLSKATEEITSNIKLIERLQSKLSVTEDAEKTEHLVKSMKARIKKLEEKLVKKEQQLKIVEKEAEAESAEHAALMARIHAYEMGEYGLSEAIMEIKDLKSQIRIRDKQVESVTQEINILQMQVHDLEDENEMLRNKIGLDKNIDVSRETKRYQKNRKNEIIALRSKVNHMEETIVQLKTLNYSLKKQLAQLDQIGEGANVSISQGGLMPAERDRPDGGSVASPKPSDTLTILTFKTEDWREKYEIILEENTALRKGLQEILETMNKLTDEESSEIIIQSPVLEDLLREMSARGIINYPYPITSFHLKVCNLEGKCSQLREDLYRIRQEEKECRTQLLEAKAQIMIYEKELENFKKDGKVEGRNVEVVSQEIQTETFEASPPIDETLSEEDLANRINKEKEKLGGIMEDLKQRIEEMEQSRRLKDKDGEATSADAVTIADSNGNEVATKPETEPEDSIGSLSSPQHTPKDRSLSVAHRNMGTQTQPSEEASAPGVSIVREYEALTLEYNAITETVKTLNEKIQELENKLKEKDELIYAFKPYQASRPEEEHNAAKDDLQEALQVARESMTSLQDRIKSKDESIEQYRKLLAEVRKEMTNASERHVQEMRQMQLTIHHQQQAFMRMKSTLSQPVKDTVSIEGTIKDQLTRIHELEDEVSQLQHTMANVASQLTAARSDAHRWRCTAELRLKEVEQARDHFSAESMEEVQHLRVKLKDMQIKLEQAEYQLSSNKMVDKRDSLADLVSILRKELEEKDKQIGIYLKTLKSTTFNEKSHFENMVTTKEKEIEVLKEEISRHLKTISNLQLRLSKTKAINYKSGISAEVEELRLKNRELMDDKYKLEKDIHEFHAKRDEEEMKKIKTAESVARWEESKRWKKSKEKLELRVKELETENERMERLVNTLKSSIHRLEKEKVILDSRLKMKPSGGHGSSVSKSSLDNISEESGPSGVPSGSYHQNYIIAQGEIAKLQMDLQDMKELVEKTEFEGREEAEKLKMEIKCLKERIVTQERQLTAYEVAQKGDPHIVQEIQKMAEKEFEIQKEVVRLEEENLHLRLQIEQLQLESPKLRDRVQHLQRIVDALKAEKALPGHKGGSMKSQRPLGELERTITALKQVIEKLQAENQRLKGSRSDLNVTKGISSERLRSSVSALMDEKRSLVDKVQILEKETEKFQRLYMEKCSSVDSFENRLQDAENRAKSSEMKLRALLDNRKPTSVAGQTVAQGPSSTCHSYDALTERVQKLEEELHHKTKILSTAKQALKDAERLAVISSSSTRASSSKSLPQTNLQTT